jgi:hypothetical protein
MTNLLFAVITNLVTVIALPGGLCYDTGVMGAMFDTHDPRPLYGLRLSALDAHNQEISVGWVQESYVPAMTETVPVTLTPEAVAVRCEVFGPELQGKWSGGYFTLNVEQPSLHIVSTGTNAVVTWQDPGGCWTLESQSPGCPWVTSEKLFPIAGPARFFRLIRHTGQL